VQISTLIRISHHSQGLHKPLHHHQVIHIKATSLLQLLKATHHKAMALPINRTTLSNHIRKHRILNGPNQDIHRINLTLRLTLAHKDTRHPRMDTQAIPLNLLQ